MNKSSSNANMSKSTVETLKQIQQKQGLSISIVDNESSKSFSLSSPGSRESKTKQVTVMQDKASRMSPRPSSASENKPSSTQHGRLNNPEARVSAGHSVMQSNQSVFHESKTIVRERTNQTVVSESKTHNWNNVSNSISTECKSQNTSNRFIQNISVTPEVKNQGNSGRLSQVSFLETKTQSNKITQNVTVLSDNKSQNRVNQISLLTESKGQTEQSRITSSHSMQFENKSQLEWNNQCKTSQATASSTTETKVFPNQIRTNKVAIPNKNKPNVNQPAVIQKLLEPKMAGNQSTMKVTRNQSIVNPVRQEVKVPNRGNQTFKMSDNSQTRTTQHVITMSENKGINQSITQSTVTESKSTSSSRITSNVIDANQSRSSSKYTSSEVKSSSVAQMRTFPNIAVSSENQLPAHTKTAQSISQQSESKGPTQGPKFISTPSEKSQKVSGPFDISPECSPITKGAAIKRTPEISSSIVKKKCIKRSPPSLPGGKNLPSASENNAVKAAEDGAANEQNILNIKCRPAGLTITPISSSNGSGRLLLESPEKDGTKIHCTTCKTLYSRNHKWCPNCKCNSSVLPASAVLQSASAAFLPQDNLPIILSNTTVNSVTNISVSKHIIFNSVVNAEVLNQNRGFHIEQPVQRNVVIKASPMQISPRGKGRGRGRRRYEEPVCLTLSSDDDEEPSQELYHPFPEENSSSTSHLFSMETEEAQSSPDMNQEENQESDDPQFPGVTDIHPKPCEEEMDFEEEEDPPEEDMEEMDEEEFFEEEEEGSELEEEEEEEEEEVPPEDENDEHMLCRLTSIEKLTKIDQPLRCRSVRIGSYKIHPRGKDECYLPVYLSVDGMTFAAPVVTDFKKMAKITLTANDIECLMCHFGRCLPILFVHTSKSFGESVRRVLNMTAGETPYFDPDTTDEKQKKITFLIDSMTEDQRRFLRSSFLGEKKVHEIDQKTANEILVKSTPSQTDQFQSKSAAPQVFGKLVQLPVIKNIPCPVENQMGILAHISNFQGKCPASQEFGKLEQSSVSKNIPSPVENQMGIPVHISNQLQITKVPQASPKAIHKLITYPPPPQTGGIAITTEDLICLNEGEFLNDAIIDFYLKYVYYEKLSDYHRDKTHIFSSYFYPRLTHKPERTRPGEEGGQKTMQVRRHNQVKTWTRHIDIFSKDFIIIPVNQNVHWFLAIICYPSLVPDAPNSPVKDDKINKSADNVTSTDDQEDINKISAKDHSEEDNQNLDENSMTSSNNSLCESEDSPDSEELTPEAPDSSTHPDGNLRRKETPCICIFDSLSGPNRWRIAATLREYLEMEWKMKKGTKKIFDKNTMQGFVLRCPQQTNFSDCGIYVLQYVESFFENPIPYFGNPMPDLSNWFAEADIVNKRQELRDLIWNLRKKQGDNSPMRRAKQTDSVPPSIALVQRTDSR